MELYCNVHLCVQINGHVVISPWQIPDVVMNAPGWNKDFWPFCVGLQNAFPYIENSIDRISGC